MSSNDTWDVFAVKFSAWEGRLRHENFIIADPHDGPGPMFFYVWVLRNGQRTIVLDTGFDKQEAHSRGRSFDMPPREALAMMGIESDKITDVIISHLHWDHAGSLDDFSAATFHIQDKEVQFATGRCMCQHFFRRSFTIEHVLGLVRRVYDGRVQFHDGQDTIAPGVTVHLIGGHTMGVQCVRVNTRRGAVVLASDTLHFYENMDAASPYPTVYNVSDMIEGWDKLRRLAESPVHIIPGHDPRVMDQYPALSDALQGRVARLDVDPRD